MHIFGTHITGDRHPTAKHTKTYTRITKELSLGTCKFPTFPILFIDYGLINICCEDGPKIDGTTMIYHLGFILFLTPLL